MEFICYQCSIIFKDYPGRKRKFCSHKCRGLFKSKGEEHRKIRLKKYYQCNKNSFKERRIKNIINSRKSNKEYLLRLRNAVIELLGCKCIHCGFHDIRALQIDHINGGGSQERKNLKGTFYKIVMDSIINNENKYQLLCANCNWIKRVENGENRK